MHLLGRRRILKSPGVRYQPGVESRRSRGADPPAKPLQQVVDELCRRRGIGIDHCHVAEAAVGAVMVNNDEMTRALGGRGEIAQPFFVGCITGNHNVELAGELFRRHEQREIEEAELPRDCEGISEGGDDLLAGVLSTEGETDDGAERIAVRVDVPHHSDALSRGEHTCRHFDRRLD